MSTTDQTTDRARFTAAEFRRRISELVAEARRHDSELTPSSKVEIGHRNYPRWSAHRPTFVDEVFDDHDDLRDFAEPKDRVELLDRYGIRDHGAILHLYLSNNRFGDTELVNTIVVWLGTDTEPPALLDVPGSKTIRLDTRPEPEPKVIHYMTGSSTVACGEPVSPVWNADDRSWSLDGLNLGDMSVDISEVTCSKCRPGLADDLVDDIELDAAGASELVADVTEVFELGDDEDDTDELRARTDFENPGTNDPRPERRADNRGLRERELVSEGSTTMTTTDHHHHGRPARSIMKSITDIEPGEIVLVESERRPVFHKVERRSTPAGDGPATLLVFDDGSILTRPSSTILFVVSECAAGEHELDDTADETDRCVVCGSLVCPDTGTSVDYDPSTDRYWHRDDSTCFLHQRTRAELVIGAGAEIVIPVELARELVAAVSDTRAERVFYRSGRLVSAARELAEWIESGR